MSASSSVGSAVLPAFFVQQPGSMPLAQPNKPVVVLSPEDEEGLKETMRVAFAILKHIMELKLRCLNNERMECIDKYNFEHGPVSHRAAMECLIKTGSPSELKDGSGSLPRADFPPGEWCIGPDWKSATKIGLVLAMTGGTPALITPLGAWQTGILSESSWSQVREAIDSLQGPLGLKLIQDITCTAGKTGDHGPYYSINTWEGKDLPKPCYRNPDELLPLERIKGIWETLAQEFFFPNSNALTDSR